MALLLSCDSPVERGPRFNPPPILESVQPELLEWSEPATVEVRGEGFVEGTAIHWNGSPRPSEFRSSTHLTGEVRAADVAEVGHDTVTVVSPGPGGGSSEPRTVKVVPPTPTLDSIAPTTAEALTTPGLQLRVHGSDFAPGRLVRWNDLFLPTTSVSPSELNAEVGDHLLQTGDTVYVSVVNPGPSNRQSSGMIFEVRNPVPAVTDAAPDSVTLRTGATVSLAGSLFTTTTTVRYNGTRLIPDAVSASSLTVSVPPELNTRGGVSLHVENPPPAGGPSNEIDIPVRELPPYLGRLSPGAVKSGAGAFTLELHGADFAPDATATWDGDPRELNFVGEERVEMLVEAADISDDGTPEIAVVNPRGGGQSQVAELFVLPEEGLLPAGRLLTGGHAIDIDGSDRKPVPTGGSAPYQFDAAPRGSRALFTKEAAGSYGSNARLRIFEADPSTGTFRRVTGSGDEARLYEEGWPKYSSDGSWIYFQGHAQATGITGVWRIRPNGDDLERLTPERYRGRVPAPSSGGDRVSFAGEQGLSILDLATGTIDTLDISGGVSRWSPDDRWIAYTQMQALFLVRPDGTENHRLAYAPGWFDFDWSPDGEFIVFRGYDGMALVRVETGQVQSLPWLRSLGHVAWYDDP